MSTLSKSTTAFATLATILALSLISIGCSQGDSSTSEHGPPWVTIRDDKLSGTSSRGIVGEDGSQLMEFEVFNAQFYRLLENICDHFQVSVVVRPKELLDRGITITVTGLDAQATLENLASQCKLQLENLGDKKWRLAAQNSENAPEQTVTYETD